MIFLTNRFPRLISLPMSAIFVSGTSGITAILKYRRVNPINSKLDTSAVVIVIPDRFYRKKIPSHPTSKQETLQISHYEIKVNGSVEVTLATKKSLLVKPVRCRESKRAIGGWNNN